MSLRTSGRPPVAKTKERGLKPFINKGAHPDMMRTVTTDRMSRSVVERHSEGQRPYFHDSYLEMDEMYPDPYPSPQGNPGGLPPVQIENPKEEVERLLQSKCAFLLHNPLSCDEPVWMQFGIVTESLDFGNNRFRIFINGVETIYYYFEGRKLFINPPTGRDWVSFPDSPADEVRMVVRKRKDEDGHIYCKHTIEVFCRTVCCPAPVTFEFDDDSTPDTIAPGGSITVFATGGCAPYTWIATGGGYTWADGSSTVNPQNTLVSASGT